MNRRSRICTVGTVIGAVLLAAGAASAGPVKYKPKDHRGKGGASAEHDGRRGDTFACRGGAAGYAAFSRNMYNDCGNRPGGDRGDSWGCDAPPARTQLAGPVCGAVSSGGGFGLSGAGFSFSFGCSTTLVVAGDGWTLIVLSPGFHGRLNALLHRLGLHRDGVLYPGYEDDDRRRHDRRYGRGDPEPTGPGGGYGGGGPGGGPIDEDGGGDGSPPNGQPVPLPTPAMLAGVGLAGIVARRRRRGAGMAD